MARLGKIATAKEKGAYCPICDELVPIITLQDDMCRDCFKAEDETPTCLYCNERVEQEGDFYCEDCIKGFKYDMRDKSE